MKESGRLTLCANLTEIRQIYRFGCTYDYRQQSQQEGVAHERSRNVGLHVNTLALHQTTYTCQARPRHLAKQVRTKAWLTRTTQPGFNADLVVIW